MKCNLCKAKNKPNAKICLHCSNLINKIIPDTEVVLTEVEVVLTEIEQKYSTIDGPRYAVALQTEKDPYCYKDIFETEKITEAKENAEKEAAKTNRSTWIWDRKEHGIIHRIEKEVIENPKKKKK